MPNSVRHYNSEMSGHPSLSGTSATLPGVLDACLVYGFGSVTVDSLSITSNVATASVSGGHQFSMIGATGPVIRMAAQNLSAIDGDYRITITSATQFTFPTTGISNQTVTTGTMTAKLAPAGFTKSFTDTNKAVYRSNNIMGTRLYLRINDSGTTNARIRGYEAMDDIDTVTSGYGVFPTDAQLSGGGYVYKSNAASSAERKWSLFSDGRMIYFFCDPSNSDQWTGGFLFGDLDSYVVSDQYGCMIVSSNSSSGNMLSYSIAASSANYLARSVSQLGGSVAMNRYSNGRTGEIGNSGPTYSGSDTFLWPIEAWDGTANQHGLIPGLWNPIHTGMVHGTVIEAVPQLSGRSLFIQLMSGVRAYGIDVTGPWR